MNTGYTSVKDRIQAKQLEEERLAREHKEAYEKMKENLLDSKAFKDNQKLVSRLNQKIFLKKKELEEMQANRPVDITHNSKEEEA